MTGKLIAIALALAAMLLISLGYTESQRSFLRRGLWGFVLNTKTIAGIACLASAILWFVDYP